MEQCIASPDVRQESIAETLALRRTLDKSGNVDDVQEGRNLAATI